MKKWMICIILLFAASQSWSQSRLGFSTDGGFTWQMDDIDETTPKTGGLVSLNGWYSFQHKKFLLQAGFGVTEAWLVQGVENLHEEVSMLDTENMPYTLHMDLTGRRDIVAATELNVPFMFGLKVNHFYIMMGAKFAVTLVGKAHMQANLTTKGDYGDRYYGMLENMPQHGFYDRLLVESRSDMQFRPDLRLCLEGGWTIPMPYYARRSTAPQLQLGAFFEYGLLNTIDKDNEVYVELDYSEHTKVKMNHIYTVFDRKDVMVNSLRVGVRATFLFPVRTKEERECNCSRF
jgi:hypothetical protein